MKTFTDIDAVVFDCDGVLLDSNLMKVEAFRRSALGLGFDRHDVESFTRWQSNNFGQSRYVVFERLLAGDFGAVPAGATLEELLRRYARDIAVGYHEVSETDGARELLGLLKHLPLYVVSASDEQELREVFRALRLASYFQAIYGSPSTKAQNLERVSGGLTAGSRVLFIGDAVADANAAAAVGMQFVFMSRHSLVREEMQERSLNGEFSQIDSLRDLVTVATSETRIS